MKVLVVDDEPTVLVPVCGMLRLLKHDAKDASTGEGAIELADAMEALDVAIIDQRLPGRDGFTTASELKKKNPDLYLIMLTGYASIEEAVEAIRDQRFDDYLQKPIDMQHLEIALVRAKTLVESRNEAKRLRTEIEALRSVVDEYEDSILKYKINYSLGNRPLFLRHDGSPLPPHNQIALC